MSAKKNEPPQIPFAYHGLFGGTAGAIGICAVQPMDMIKTRMQLLGEQGKKGNVFAVTRDIIKKDGFLSLWHGVSCSVFRQYTYGLTRFFVFFNMLEAFKRKYGHPPNVALKCAMGSLAGGIGAVVGTPADVALIRMTAEGSLPPEKKKGYKHVIDALIRITREEGLLTLWTGVEATITRAILVSAAELGSYTQARELILPHSGEGILLHFCSSMIAGIFATAISLPADIIKTRVQNSPGGKASQITVLRDILAKEGVRTLWSGFLPTYMKLGPHAVLTFMIFEQFYILYWKIKKPPD
ncbi:mitochondrial carrier protein domain-containing protein [Phthorimaea operculella]|nr:mitochondrial carrier protein domain-containing protein [Phthorimaea operculella]